VLWYLYLRPGGESFIVHSYRDLEYEAEVRSGGDADEIGALPDFDNDPAYEIYWCAPTTEIFAYRFWIENTLWYALHGDQPIENLNEDQLVYLSHYTPNEVRPDRSFRIGAVLTTTVRCRWPVAENRAFARAFLDRYPDIDAVAGENSPWSSAPLIGEASGPLMYFPMVWSGCEEVSAWAAQLAYEHGLVCTTRNSIISARDGTGPDVDV
jgi:hypothetical protein